MHIKRKRNRSLTIIQTSFCEQRLSSTGYKNIATCEELLIGDYCDQRDPILYAARGSLYANDYDLRYGMIHR